MFFEEARLLRIKEGVFREQMTFKKFSERDWAIVDSLLEVFVRFRDWNNLGNSRR